MTIRFAWFLQCLRRVLPLAALLATVASGEITRITYNGWDDALRLTNGTVELIVVPSVGRIMHYGWTDGENLLWQHPHRAGHTGPAAGDLWANTGGDKIWPWPETSWPKASGVTLRDVDPPSEWEHEPHQLEVRGPLSVRLISPTWKTHRLRVVRDLTLAETGTVLTLSSRIERIADVPPSDTPPPIAVRPWSVTQLPPADAVIVDYVPHTPRPYGLLLGASWDTALDIDTHTLWLPSPRGASKIGVTGRHLGWWRGEVLFIQHLVAPIAAPTAWEPHEQAQVFWTENPGEGASPYVELEFTAPRGGSPTMSETLTVTWELRRLRSKRPTMDEVVATFMMALPAASPTPAQ